VETTRQQVLRLVRGHKTVTVAQLAATLGLSQPAVRRHLDALRVDGYVDAKLVRHGVGRPALLFFPTELAEEMAGRGYIHLLSRLFRSLDHMKAEAAASDSDVLQRAMAQVALEVAAEHRTEMGEGSLEERVSRVSEVLKPEGIVDGWEKEGDGYRLLNHDCPYLRVAELNDAPCRSDRQTIELLVGASVEQLSRIVDGGPVCEYLVRGPEPAAVTTKKRKSGVRAE
jgi:predicted ArsR family transcriptional regulator